MQNVFQTFFKFFHQYTELIGDKSYYLKRLIKSIRPYLKSSKDCDKENH